MELESIDVLTCLALLVPSVVMAYLACRKICSSPFDYWIVIGAQQAFVLPYAAYCYLNDMFNPEHFAFIVSGLGAFALGTYVFARPPAPAPREPARLEAHHLLWLRCALYAMCVEQAIADLAFISSRGLPGLADGINPTIYGGGFGIVKYLHDANFPALTAIGFLLLVFDRDVRAFVVAMVFVAYPQILLEWSKSSLLYVPLLMFTMNQYARQRFGVALRVRARRILPFLIPLAILFVSYKFAIIVVEGYADSVPQALAKRVLNTSDSLLMYFQLGGHQYFEGEIGVVSYLLAHVTPYLGIHDTAQEFGVLLPQYTLGIGAEGYGAYPPFQIVAHLTMGRFGLLYCFGIGAALAWIRRVRVTPRHAVPYFVCLFAAPFLTGDSSLFVYYFFCQLFNVPALLAAAAAYAVLRPRAEAETPGAVAAPEAP